MNPKKTLDYITNGDNITSVAAKSVAGIDVPKLQEAQHASNPLEKRVFFCACSPALWRVGRGTSVHRFLVAVRQSVRLATLRLTSFCGGIKPTYKETANV